MKKVIINILSITFLLCVLAFTLFAVVGLINHIINNPSQNISLPILGILSALILGFTVAFLSSWLLLDLLTSSRYESKEKEFKCTESTDKEGSIICDISGKSTEKNKSIDFNNETINAITLDTDIKKLEIKNINNFEKINIGNLYGSHINHVEELTIDNINATDIIDVYLLDNKSKNFTLNISNITLNASFQIHNIENKVKNLNFNISNIYVAKIDNKPIFGLPNQNLNDVKFNNISNVNIFIENIDKINSLKISNIDKSWIIFNNLGIQKLEISNFNINDSMILMDGNVKIGNLKINHNNNKYIIENFSYNNTDNKMNKLIKFKYLESEIEFNEKEYFDSSKLKSRSIYDIIIHKLESLTPPPTDLSQSSLSSSQTEKT